MNDALWDRQNPCRLSLAFIIDWRVVVMKKITHIFRNDCRVRLSTATFSKPPCLTLWWLRSSSMHGPCMTAASASSNARPNSTPPAPGLRGRGGLVGGRKRTKSHTRSPLLTDFTTCCKERTHPISLGTVNYLFSAYCYILFSLVAWLNILQPFSIISSTFVG